MNRLAPFAMLFAILPIVAGAQTPAPAAPPAPPAPAARPAPAPRPAPPVLPARAFDGYAMDEVMNATREAQRISADVAREVAAQAREIAAEQRALARVDVDRTVSAARAMSLDFNYDFAFDQARTVGVSTTWAQGDETYNSGRNALSQRQYDRAITSFDRVIAQKGERTDAALYWKAFSQYKLGRWDDALASLTQLRRDHTQSRYLNDAKVLDADVRKMSGQKIDPATFDDDELKLLAISGLSNSDQAVPIAEGVLNATNSLAVKGRALYVLAQRDEPRARQIVLNYAKGAGNPDLQRQAISYIGSRRDRPTTSAELREIYESTQDADVRRAIIDAYRSAGDKAALISIASTGTTPVAIRRSAISGLTNLAAPAELWALYQKETDKDLRMQMVSVFGSMGAVDQLQQVIKSEKEVDVRRAAIRRLGGLKSDKTGAILADLYSAETDVENRKVVIGALSSQNNVEGLIAIARKETNRELKVSLVNRLSEMARTSKAAADYLAEILK